MLVDEKIDVAKIPIRLAAFIVDIIAVRVIFLIVASWEASTHVLQLGNQVDGIMPAIALLYFPIFTLIFSASPGKLGFKMKVVRTDGSKASAGKILLREISGIFLLGALGYLWCLFNKKNRALWDFLAGTIVISVDGKQKAPSPLSEIGKNVE